MRIKLERPLAEKDYGKTRTISKFLWFPKKINYEIRWLEGVLIEQIVDFEFVYDRDCPRYSYRKYYWRDKKWVNPPTNLR